MSVYEDLANALFFGKDNTLESIKSRFGLVLRKNKTISDINNALIKAKKNGLGKVEFEVSMLEIYLKDVLKKG